MRTHILAAVRTPQGKFLGTLADRTAMQLAAALVPSALSTAAVPVATVEDVIIGQVIQAGCGQNPARQVALAGGLPVTIPATTINKVCGSGLKALMLGDQAIRSDDVHVVLAGGMESMSNAPHLVQGMRQGYKFGDVPLVDALQHDGLTCAYERWSMGNAAEYIAQKWGITRAVQDRYAAQSHDRAAKAWQQGWFQDEVVPVTNSRGKTLSEDEGIRPDTTAEILGKLRPAFDPAGTVTAGNASSLSDGAALVVLASTEYVTQNQSPTLATIVATATSGVEPRDIFLAPVTAIEAVLRRATLSLDQIDLFEINEAFAAQVLVCLHQLKLPEAKVNVHGGGIALGHPIGCSGARVVVTLTHALRQHHGRYGLAVLCLGGGNAVAMIIERR